MKKLAICTLAMLLLASVTLHAAETVEGDRHCALCGMDRATFAYSRMVVTFDNKTTVMVCSLHCAVEEMTKQKNRKVTSLLVADYDSKKLLDAYRAIWVLGGKRNGVMTSPAKWAFSRKQEAQSFVRENGGRIVPFTQIMKAVTAEVAEMNKPPVME